MEISGGNEGQLNLIRGKLTWRAEAEKARRWMREAMNILAVVVGDEAGWGWRDGAGEGI